MADVVLIVMNINRNHLIFNYHRHFIKNVNKIKYFPHPLHACDIKVKF